MYAGVRVDDDRRGGGHASARVRGKFSAQLVEKFAVMYDVGERYGARRNGKNTGGWHVPEAGEPDEAVRHSRGRVSGIVRGGSERQVLLVS